MAKKPWAIAYGALLFIAVAASVWKWPVAAPFAAWIVLALVWFAPRAGVRSRMLAAAYGAVAVFCFQLVFQNLFFGRMVPPPAKGLALYPELAAGLLVIWAAALIRLRRGRAVRWRIALDIFITFTLAGTCVWVGYKLWPWQCGAHICRESGVVFCYINNRDNFGVALGPATGRVYISTADEGNSLTSCAPSGPGGCVSRPRGDRTAYRIAADPNGARIIALRGHREGEPGTQGALLVYLDRGTRPGPPRVLRVPRRGARDVWVDPESGALFVLYKNGALERLSPRKLRESGAGTARMAFPYRISGLDGHGGPRLFVSGLFGDVSAWDAIASGRNVRVRLMAGAAGLAADPRRGRVFVAEPFLRRVAMLRADTLRRAGSMPAPYFVREVAADPGAGRVFAGSYRSGRLWILDADTGRIVSRRVCGPMLRQILPDPRTRVVYAATRCGVFGFKY